MAGWPPAKNAAFTWYFVIRDADGDLVAGATALDVEFSVDGGVFADVAGTEVDEGQGFYSCPISAAEMNGDVIMLMCKTTSAGAKTAAQIIYTSTRQIDNLAFPTVSGRSLDVTATGAAGIDFGNIEGTLAAAAIATGAITAEKFAAGAIDATVIGQGAIDADAIADNAIDTLAFAPDTGLQTIRSNVAQAGAAGTITVDAGASALDDFYNGCRIYLTGATGVGQYRLIFDYVGATKVASISPNWITNPDGTTRFSILPAGMADVQLWLRLLVNALIAGRVDASVGAMAADVLTAAALASDAVDEIWDEVMVEPAQAIPAATPALRTVLAYLYTALRNAITVSSTELTFSNDAGTVTFKKALSDAAGVYTEAEAVSGP